MKEQIRWEQLPWVVRIGTIAGLVVGGLWLLFFIIGIGIGLSGV